MSKDKATQIPVTVLMAVYNTEEQYLREAVESILAQSFKKFEFIIIDDGSDGGTKDIIKSYKDPRIRLIENETNMGLTMSLNKGLKLARGKYIARMDADDISRRNRLTVQFKYMETHPEVAVVGCSMQVVGTGNILKPVKCLNDEDRRVKLLFDNAGVFHPTAFMRKSFLENFGIRYNDRIKKAQDYDLWVKICNHGGLIKNLQDVLFEYRIHGGQITNMTGGEQMFFSRKIRELQWREIGLHLGKSDIECLADFMNYGAVENYELYKAIKRLLKQNHDLKIINRRYLKREIVRLWIMRIGREIKHDHEFNGLRYIYTWEIINPYYLSYFLLNRF